MKIVVQNPQLLGDTETSGINDWGVEFLKLYKPAVHITSMKEYARWIKFLRKKKLPLLGWTYVNSERGLSNYDVWIGWQGTHRLPYDVAPPKSFSGLKVFHVMDYVFRAQDSAKILKDNGVDYLLGYGCHDLYCSFFQKFFPDFIDRVIAVPFGHSKRFSHDEEPCQQIDKISAMGAVNLVKDLNVGLDVIGDYAEHFSHEMWAHPSRSFFRSHHDELASMVQSYLPPEGKRVNLAYDSPSELRKHRFYLNDVSVLQFPPARTYEGAASGSIMFSKDNACLRDFGWKDEENCILFDQLDMTSLKDRYNTAMEIGDQLNDIRARSVEKSMGYAHKQIAIGLHDILKTAVEKKIKGYDSYSVWNRNG